MVIMILAFLLCVASVQGQLSLPQLEYAYDDLDPIFNAETVELHYSKHFAGYITKVNAALANCGLEISSFDELAEKILPTIGEDGNCVASEDYVESEDYVTSIVRLVQPAMEAFMNMITTDNDTDIDSGESIVDLCPEEAFTIRNNGGGAYNHNLFFSLLTPQNSSSVDDIGDELSSKIEQTFGSIDMLISEMSSQGGKVFGSGWVWLLLVDGKLQIITTPNQDNPFMPFVKSGTPLLAIDVWEHAYYLKYKNRRAEYLEMIWNVINWEKVNELFMASV
eukprot:TRINITY_DN9797_c0_g2_i1.p1 TRINITY_DN9797_c0_g2~~TRINITY_DN9797_c0_g2_i1.p1  ORF type:complete len:279 (-),score=36.51 TRINITY_DN9797_c0_g2_i1:359-1195(-)